MAYPTNIDSPQGTASQGTSLLSSPDHALDHRTLGSAVIAIENKLGVGAGSAAANQILVGTASGTSNWQQTWNNGTLGTPTITGGTISGGLVGGTANFSAGTANSLTLGTPTFQQWDGWILPNETWSMLGTTTNIGSVQVAATSGKYDIGDPVKFTQGGTQMYGNITGTPSGTVFTITGGIDYVYGTTAITAPSYAKEPHPQAFPHWFNYTPSWTGFSSNPTGGLTRFSVSGRICTYMRTIGTAGTSSASSFTISLPIPSSANLTTHVYQPIIVSDNGAALANPGMADFTANSSTLNILKDLTGAVFTASNLKDVRFQLAYEI